MYLESAWHMTMRVAELYDSGVPCGAEANAAKLLGARAGHDSCWQSIATHGGFGYAKEYPVERIYREIAVTRLAPITEQLIMSFIAEKVLDLPSCGPKPSSRSSPPRCRPRWMSSSTKAHF